MSHYTRLLAKLFDDNIPFSALIELTYRCNLDCFFCYNDRYLQGQPLSREQYFSFFGDLRELGTMNLTLSGGEPLAHPHFFALGRKARDLGFVVRIKSNGHALRRQTIDRIREEIDPYIIEISLHGASAETHDRQTRTLGSYNRLMNNLHILKQLNVRIQLNTPLTAWNEAELEAMYALADNLDIPIIIDPTITPRDDGDCEPLAIAPSSQCIAKFYQRLKNRSGQNLVSSSSPEQPTAPKSSKHCGAGSSGITVDPFGNIYPCVQWRVAAGNLHQRSIKDIWHYSPVLEDVRTQTETVAAVVEQSYGKAGHQAGFCPGLAHQIEGTPVKIDAQTLRRIDLFNK